MTTKPKKVSEEDLLCIKDNLHLSQGTLMWNESKSGRRFLNRGALRQKGYRKLMIDGKSYMEHRVVYYLSTGVWPGDLQIDHINGDPSDNSPENLRLVDSKGNHRSHKTKRGTTSRYRGVSWNGSRKKWVVNITVDGVKTFLGRFTNEKEAGLAYNYAALSEGFYPESFNNVFGE